MKRINPQFELMFAAHFVKGPQADAHVEAFKTHNRQWAACIRHGKAMLRADRAEVREITTAERKAQADARRAAKAAAKVEAVEVVKETEEQIAARLAAETAKWASWGKSYGVSAPAPAGELLFDVPAVIPVPVAA